MSRQGAWYRVTDGLYSLQHPGTGHTAIIGSRDEVERELHNEWDAHTLDLIASGQLAEGEAPNPSGPVTHVTQTLVQRFPTPEGLREFADRIEAAEPPDKDSRILAQLLRKIADALEKAGH